MSKTIICSGKFSHMIIVLTSDHSDVKVFEESHYQNPCFAKISQHKISK